MAEKYTDEKLVPRINNLKELIAELHEVFNSQRVNVEYVQSLMSAYKSNPIDWKEYAKFDAFRYTRNLVDEGNGKFNLMAICWGEGHGSSVHDHSSSHCFMKILDGSLQETMFHWPAGVADPEKLPGGTEQEVLEEEEEPLQEIARNIYPKDAVTYINDTMGLHRVENISHTDKAVSLHLYSPPFGTCRTFDQRTGHQNTVQMTFCSKYGKRVAEESNQKSCPTSGGAAGCPIVKK